LLLKGQVQRATATFVANSAPEKLYYAGFLELEAEPMGTLVGVKGWRGGYPRVLYAYRAELLCRA
jgi:hypothetical protein